MMPVDTVRERGHEAREAIRNQEMKPEMTKRAPLTPEILAKRLAQMKHDMRGPLNAILGLSGILAASDTLSSQHKEMAVTLQSSAEDLRKLVESMSDLTRPKEEVLAPQGGKTGKKAEKSKPLLLVEDYAPTILMMSKFLEELGYEYEVSKTGREALEKFSGGGYGCILMDLQLPDMDGLDATRRIRAMEKQDGLAPVPIIATSGMDEDRMFCLKAGMNDCLSKPFRLEDLERKLVENCLCLD